MCTSQIFKVMSDEASYLFLILFIRNVSKRLILRAVSDDREKNGLCNHELHGCITIFTLAMIQNVCLVLLCTTHAPS